MPRIPDVAKTRNTDGTDAKGTSSVGNAVKPDADGMSVLRVYVMSAPTTTIVVVVVVVVSVCSGGRSGRRRRRSSNTSSRSYDSSSGWSHRDGQPNIRELCVLRHVAGVILTINRGEGSGGGQEHGLAMNILTPPITVDIMAIG